MTEKANTTNLPALWEQWTKERLYFARKAYEFDMTGRKVKKDDALLRAACEKARETGRVINKTPAQGLHGLAVKLAVAVYDEWLDGSSTLYRGAYRDIARLVGRDLYFEHQTAEHAACGDVFKEASLAL